MRLEEFLALEKVEEVNGEINQQVVGLTYDSRKVMPGQVFFAIPGGEVDGHEFVAQALQRGAAAVVVGRKRQWPEGATSIRVNDVRRAMGLWAAHFFGHPSDKLKLVGVTGTNGKTTMTYLVESMLKQAGLEPGVIGTVNYRYRGHEVPSHHTTPESLDLEGRLAEMSQAGVMSVAIEVSSHALVQERVCGLEFDVAVFTNLSREHLDYHVDMDDYFRAKSKLFVDHLQNSKKPNRAAVIFGADPRGVELLSMVRDCGLEAWSYGENQQWDIHPLEIQNDVAGLRGRLKVKGRILEFSSHLIGTANLQNILGAVGVGFALGLPADSIVQGIGRLNYVPGRLEKIDNNLAVSILVDYAHTPDALEKVLGAVRPLTQGRVLTVFGCGGDRDRGKRPLMGEIAARLSDGVILTSDNPRTENPLKILAEVEAGVARTGLKKLDIANPAAGSEKLEMQSGYCVEADRRAAIRMALNWARPGDLLLIAGKGHEDYQILGTEKIHFDDREVAREEAGRRAHA